MSAYIKDVIESALLSNLTNKLALRIRYCKAFFRKIVKNNAINYSSLQSQDFKVLKF